MSFKKYRLNLFLIVFLTLGSQQLIAQSLLSDQSLRTLNVQSLNDRQISKIINEMEARNLSINELENMALKNGMLPSDFQILKGRLENNSANLTETNAEDASTAKEVPVSVDKGNVQQEKKLSRRIFGSEIFLNRDLNFNANDNMATPANYILGYGDEIMIVVYGMQEYTSTAVVNREGKIRIQGAGELHVGGLSFNAAEASIKKSLARIYRSLPNGQSQVSVSITKIRTINVTIIGSNKPGNYSISSMSTLFNALYAAGGPDENGSYRNIEVIRNNKVFKTIDLYKYLVDGDQSGNINLIDNDVIRIPVYTRRVVIEGEIKRPGYFELLPNESFKDLLRYCGGFTEAAYKGKIKLTQNTDTELKITDLNPSTYMDYQPQNADVFRITQILSRFENRVSIKGSVFRPDDYELTEGLSVRDLILKADGLTEDAFHQIASLYRLKEDFTKEVVTINLDMAMAGDSKHNIILRREDELLIASVLELREDFKVSVFGQVQKPGQFPYVDNLSLFDLIILAGGFTDGASRHIEISRVIKKDTVLPDFNQSSDVIILDLEDGKMNDINQNVSLMPGDVVQVRKMPIYQKFSDVVIEGAVIYPGSYILANKQERVLDVINRSGGLTQEANVEGISLKRQVRKNGSPDPITVSIPIDYRKISNNPNSKSNIYLTAGDEIVVPRTVNSVKIFGAVQQNTVVPYSGNKGLRHYVSSSGGFNRNADPKKVYVIYANGRLKSTKNYVFFKNYPKVKPGSEIVVPVEDREGRIRMSITEIASITGVVGSLSGMTISIITLLSK